MSINASVARSFLAMTPVPGVAVSAVLALAALQLNTLDPLAWASPMVIAMILGMIARNTVGAPTWRRRASTSPCAACCGLALFCWACGSA